MNANELLVNRRSIRKYKDEIVDKKLMEEIMELTKFYPSWGNTQTVRFHFVQNKEMINKIHDSAVKGFTYNQKTLKYAKNVLVLSFVKGSGKIKDIETTPEEVSKWAHFDAGIACQQFSLAAFSKGVGSTIFGVIDEKEIASIINLPEDQTVAAILTYGYINDDPKAPPRKEVSDISNFIK